MSFGGGYVLAQPALRRHILQLADGEPDRPGFGSGLQRCQCSAPAHGAEYQVPGQDTGVPGPELIIHQSPEVTNTHVQILSRVGDPTIKP